MSDKMPYGADTLVIPFTFVPEPSSQPAPAQAPEGSEEEEED